MAEEIIRVVKEKESHGMIFRIVETRYEFGRHYVLMIGNTPGFHSTDLSRVSSYMDSLIR